MNQQRDDKELEHYLDGASAESRRYAELGVEQPPPEIDARILAEAERAVKVTQLPARRTPPFKAFAWAAIVVLSFSLVLNILFREMPRDQLVEMERMAGRSAIPATTAPTQAPEMMDTVKSTARAQSGEAAVAKDSLAAPPARKRVAEEASRDNGTLAMTPQLAGDAPADDLVAHEISVMARKVEAKPAAAAVEPITTDAYQKKQAREPVMQVVADYIAPSVDADRGTALAGAMPDDSEADAELGGILDRYDEGGRHEAMADLAGFRVKYPQHPVSLVLADRGL